MHHGKSNMDVRTRAAVEAKTIEILRGSGLGALATGIEYGRWFMNQCDNADILRRYLGSLEMASADIADLVLATTARLAKVHGGESEGLASKSTENTKEKGS